jgi:WD40 repeat protein
MHFANSIVRVDSGTTVCGSGFVIADNLVITCAHVVTNKSGFVLHALSVVFHATGERRAAEVVPEWWRDSTGDDIAVIRFSAASDESVRAASAMPDGVERAILGDSTGVDGHEGETFGYPDVGKINGIPGHGRVGSHVQEIAGRRLISLTSGDITSGFSGAPFVDTKRRRVIGMVSEILDPDEHSRLGKIALLTPSETIREVCSFLQLSDLCPYQGLSAFSEESADLFFGRDRLVADFADHLRRFPSMLVIVGSSGSGKSSIVRAGLIPQLRRKPPTGFRDLTIVVCRPGSEPENGLRGALQAAGSAADDIRLSIRSLVGEARGRRLVIVIDQFEEVFVGEAAGRHEGFLATLTELKQDKSVTLIIVVRADFYEPLLRSPLGVSLGAAQVNVAPMTQEEQREAIVRPAESVGLTLEEGLVTLIQRDLERVDHPLPLLEFAMTELWNGRKDGQLTVQEYGRIGGVAGSLSQWASAAYDALPADRQVVAREIFTRLVHYGDGLPDSQRRVPLAALVGEDRNAPVREVISLLADARLIAIHRDDSRGGEDVVEIIHDALIREWPLLANWIRERRSFLVWRQRLQSAVDEWEAHGRSDDWLLRGGSLAEASRQVEQHRGELTATELRLITASTAQLEAENRRLKTAYDHALARHLASQAELLRTQDPAMLERSVLLAVESLRRAPTIDAATTLRLGLELLPCSEVSIEIGDAVKTIACSVNGRYVAAATESYFAVYDMAGPSPALILRNAATVRTMVVDSVTSTVCVVAPDAVRVWRLSDGALAAEIPRPADTRSALRSDGAFVAWQCGKVVEVWRVASSSLACRFDHPEPISLFDGLRFVGTEHLVAVGEPGKLALPHRAGGAPRSVETYVSLDGEVRQLIDGGTPCVRVWHLADARLVREQRYDGRFLQLVAERGGTRFFLALARQHLGEPAETTAFDATTGDELWRAPHRCVDAAGGKVCIVAPVPRPRRFGVPLGELSAVILYDTVSGHELGRTPPLRRPAVIGMSDDGADVLTVSNQVVQAWDGNTGRETARLGEGAHAGFAADASRMLATITPQGRIRRWRVPPAGSGRAIEATATPERLVFSAHGDILFGALGRTLTAWETTTGRKIYETAAAGSIGRLESRGGSVAGLTEVRQRVDSAGSHPVGVSSVFVCDVAKGKKVLEFIGPHALRGVALDGTGTRVAVGSDDQSLWVIKIGDGVVPPPIAAHCSPVTDVWLSSRATYVCAVGRGSSTDFVKPRDDLRVWRVADGTMCFEIDHGVSAIAFSEDERFAAVVMGAGVKVFSIENSHPVAIFSLTSRVSRVAFGPTGHVWTSAGRTVSLFDIAHPASALFTCEHEQDVWGMAVGEDGGRITTWTAQGVHVWDAHRGHETVFLRVDPQVREVSVAPDGASLAVASTDGRLRFEALSYEELIHSAESRLSRPLSRGEWEKYLLDEPFTGGK